MQQKTFTSGQKNYRLISVKVTDDLITFHYADENNREFYGFLKSDWISDYKERQERSDNFHFHLAKKTWFTPRMYEFLNEACGLPKENAMAEKLFTQKEKYAKIADEQGEEAAASQYIDDLFHGKTDIEL